MPIVLNSFNHIRLLRIRLGELREELESLSNVQDSDEYNEPGPQHLNFHPEHGRNRLQNAPGRPRIQITQAQLEALHNGAGFRWNDISRILQVSSRTLRRRRHELGMRVDGREFTDLTNVQLDGIIREVLGVFGMKCHGFGNSRIRSCSTVPPNVVQSRSSSYAQSIATRMYIHLVTVLRNLTSSC